MKMVFILHVSKISTVIHRTNISPNKLVLVLSL